MASEAVVNGPVVGRARQDAPGLVWALLVPSLLAMAWLVWQAQWFWSHVADLNFGWVVVLLCAYLFYEAWETRPSVNWALRWWAIPFALLGPALLFVVQIYQASMGTNAASTAGLALGTMCVIFANLGLVFGWAGVRKFGMAYAFLLVAMPMPSAIHGPLVGGLQDLVAAVDTEILNLIGIPAQQVGSLIHLPGGTVGIAEACSGIRSLQSTVMATLFIGYLTLNRWTWQVLLLGCGIGLAIVGNLARSLYLSLMANAHGVESVEEVHDAAGWTILIFTTVGVILISWLLNKLQRSLDEALRAASATAGTRSDEGDGAETVV